MKKYNTVRRTHRPYIVLVLFLFGSSTATPLSARERDSRPGAPADSVVARSLLEISSRHPRVRKSAGQLAAKIARSKYAKYFYPDPKLGLVYSNLPSGRFEFDRTPMTGIELQFRQPIPFPGRLTHKARISNNAAEIARLDLAREKNELARHFLTTSVDAARLKKLKYLTENYGRQIRIVSRTARTRYGVGRGNLADVSRANLKHSEYLQRAVRYDGRLKGARERLNYFYDFSISEDSPDEKRETETVAAEQRRLLAPEELRAYFRELEDALAREERKLTERSLDIARAKIEVKSSEHAAGLARMRYYPDFEAFAAYRQRSRVPNDPVSGEDFTSFGLQMRLPLWSALTNHHNLRSQKKEREARKFARKDVAGQIVALAGDLAARKASLVERIEMYRGRLVPQARRARGSARLAYGTGGVDFDTLLNSWDTLYMQKAELIELEAARDTITVALAALYNVILPAHEENKEAGTTKPDTTPEEE